MAICRPILMSGLLSLTLLSGCSPLVTVQSIQVQSIQAQSIQGQSGLRSWFTPKTVKLQGTVGSLAPLLKGQVYELQDETGKIWVLSPNRQLKPGQRVLIQGQVRYEPIDQAGQTRTEVYIEEQQQLEP